MSTIKWPKEIVIILALVFAVSFISIEGAYAGNATRFLGFSARDSAMGGATTASPDDTSCMVKNPAGLVWIGNKIDLEYLNIIPHDVSMHTEGALSNAGKRQKSTVTYLPGGDGGISYRIPGTDKYPISVGCGLFTIAGIALDYPSSRISEALVGVYDKMIDLRSVRITPALAVAFNDKLSFGATGNIAIQALKTDLTRSDYRETGGSGKYDVTTGGGYTLGLLYKFNDMLRLGTSFESKTSMGYHHKYRDVLHYVDGPNVVNMGVAFKPIKDFEATFDTRYINWTAVKFARMAPINGGFGWRDQWVFATGGECNIKDKLKLRIGYNYGKSPIQPHVVFANALLPVIMEHHLTTGFSYFVTKSLSLDFVWEHHFMGVKADNGSGDTYSINGVGTKITGAAEVIGVGIGYKY